MLAMQRQGIIFKTDMFKKLPRVPNILIGCFVLIGLSSSAHAQEVLLPPFGLQWGGEPEELMKWASDKQLDVAVKTLNEDSKSKAIRVESARGSLPDHQAHALEARYHRGELFEVSVHYGSPNSDSKQIVNDFNELKSVLAVRYGMFSPNNKQQDKAKGFIRRSVCYHVEPVRGVILLMVLSELEDTSKGKDSARFTLIYSNQNIIPKK